MGSILNFSKIAYADDVVKNGLILPKEQNTSFGSFSYFGIFLRFSYVTRG